MKFQKTYISTAIALALFGTTACGGGGSSGSSSSSSNTVETPSSDSTPTPTPTPTPSPSTNTTATINLQAIDGYLEKATVCIDLNTNGLCDNDDIISSNKTDEKGKIQLIAEGDKLEKFNSKASAKVLVEGKKGETLNVALDGTKTELEKDLSLTRTIFPKDFESNDGKVRNVTPYTTLADKVGTTFTSEEDYTNNALKKVAESLGTTLDAIELDFNNLDEVAPEQKKEVIAALLASELLVAEDKLDQTFNDLESLETFLASDAEIKEIKKTTESKSEELSQKEKITPEEISNGIKEVVEVVENHAPVASFNVSKGFFTVTATDNSSDADGDNTIVSREWSVKDSNNNIITTKTTSKGEAFTYDFEKDGTYTIVLKVTDQKNGESTATEEVTFENHAPTANFTVSVDGLRFIATNESYDPDGEADPLTYEWNVIDISNLKPLLSEKIKSKDLEYEVSEPGFYKIDLVVTDTKGLKESHEFYASTSTFSKFECYKKEPKHVEDVESGNNYYLSNYICKLLSSSDKDLIYDWKVQGSGAECKKNSSDTGGYECTFTENANQIVTLTVGPSNSSNGKKNEVSLVKFTTEDTLIAKFADANQNATVTDVEGKEITDCNPRNGCIKNLTLDASLKDESVLPTGGSYTYTWSYGNGDSDVVENVSANLSENQKYHYVQPTEYTQTLTISDGTRTSTYTTKNSYSFSESKNDVSAYYMNFPKTDVDGNFNFDSVILVKNNESDSDVNYRIEYQQNSNSKIGKVKIGDDNYDIFNIANTYDKERLNNIFEQLQLFKNSDSISIKVIENTAVKNLYTDTIEVGDLVYLGSNTTEKYSEYSDNYSEIPMIWEVMKINGSEDENYNEVKLLQCGYFRLARIGITLDNDNASVFSWESNESIRGTLNKPFENFGDKTKENISIDIQNGDYVSRLNFNKYETNLIIPVENKTSKYNVSCNDEGYNCSYEKDSSSSPISTTDYLFFPSIEDVENNISKNFRYGYLLRNPVESTNKNVGTKFGLKEMSYFDSKWLNFSKDTVFNDILSTTVKVPKERTK